MRSIDASLNCDRRVPHTFKVPEPSHELTVTEDQKKWSRVGTLTESSRMRMMVPMCWMRYTAHVHWRRRVTGTIVDLFYCLLSSNIDIRRRAINSSTCNRKKNWRETVRWGTSLLQLAYWWHQMFISYFSFRDKYLWRLHLSHFSWFWPASLKHLSKLKSRGFFLRMVDYFMLHILFELKVEATQISICKQLRNAADVPCRAHDIWNVMTHAFNRRAQKHRCNVELGTKTFQFLS